MPHDFAAFIMSRLPSVLICCRWSLHPVSFASSISRAAVSSSASAGMPVSPSMSENLPLFMHAPASKSAFSSVWSSIGISSDFALFMASRMTFISSTDLPSSLNPYTPAALSASISTISAPFCPTVMQADCSSLTPFAAASLSFMYSTVSTESTNGFVFGIVQTAVNPPAAAARQPVLISSLYSSPGSRK